MPNKSRVAPILIAVLLAAALAWRFWAASSAGTSRAAQEKESAATVPSLPPIRADQPAPIPADRATPQSHVDAQKSEEMRRKIVALYAAATADKSAPRTHASGASPTTAGGGPTTDANTTNEVEAYSQSVRERLGVDFAPMAKGCYGELLHRVPDAQGDVVIGFEILGEPSVGGVVNSAEVRDDSTLRDPAFETCLRESFLAVNFDAPGANARVTGRFPFHFENGEVDASHSFHLKDRRNER